MSKHCPPKCHITLLLSRGATGQLSATTLVFVEQRRALTQEVLSGQLLILFGSVSVGLVNGPLEELATVLADCKTLYMRRTSHSAIFLFPKSATERRIVAAQT